MSCHRVFHSKINPIEVDELFKRKAFKDEKYLTFKVDDQTEETVDAEDITEDASENPDNLYEESRVCSEYFLIKEVEYSIDCYKYLVDVAIDYEGNHNIYSCCDIGNRHGCSWSTK